MNRFSRRDWIKGGGLASAGILLGGCTRLSSGDSPKPNIILILADDLGYGDLGCYGQRQIQTPQIDRMAAEGMRFTEQYAGSTVSAPSRACLLTGLHTGHTFVRGNGRVGLRPDPQDLTVARLLKDAGYHTAMIGKSGVSCDVDDPRHPNRKGFDHFFGFLGHEAAHRYFPTELWRDGEILRFPGNHKNEGDKYSQDLFLEDALRYLEAHVSGPFFLHLSVQLPHADLYAPPRWKNRYEGSFSEDPFEGAHYRAEPHPKATFAGMVSRLDWEVGEILAKLRGLGIDKNTLVFFTSDNGPMSEGGHHRDDFHSSGSLRGGKRDLYEGGIRVPLIARWPGSVRAGSESDLVGAFWDFLPTACDLAMVPAPGHVDGISYLPTLLGKKNEQWQHEYLYWEFHEQGGKRAVRIGDWKAVQLGVSVDPNGPIEVYSLKDDQGETKDLAGTKDDVVATARRIFAEARTSSELFSWSGEPVEKAL
ncbi:MAG: sulfatase [Acidobacteria bacterium]|nr:MAG: sulfatase [Acidobacteriota bacterium]